jgi:hypothetical protein
MMHILWVWRSFAKGENTVKRALPVSIGLLLLMTICAMLAVGKGALRGDIFQEVIVGSIYLALLLGLPVLGMISLFQFGSMERNALAHFSIGLLLLITAGIILAVEENAGGVDDFFGIFILTYPLLWLGSTLLPWSLHGFGGSWTVSAVLWLGNLVAQVFVEFVAIQQSLFNNSVPLLVLFIVLVSIAVLLLGLRRHWELFFKGLLLGLGGAALVLSVYGFGRPGGLVHIQSSLRTPAMTELVAFGLIYVLEVALFFVARFGSRPASTSNITAADGLEEASVGKPLDDGRR